MASKPILRTVDIAVTIHQFSGGEEVLITKTSDWEKIRDIVGEYPEVLERLRALGIEQLPIQISAPKIKRGKAL